ncbi:hypothetical protein [Metabacillus fastidiosus]|uniref:hypothetical protein n=1 Tax=Metabacillus fastidiosus TaxID=1458 RepID=UPI002E1B8BC7|nr:hypothetical protein [Metabacillus fastidiosus]
MLKNMLKMLTDALSKKEDSNIGKILNIIHAQVTEVDKMLLKMDEWISIENAEGAVLDDIGADINQHRGQASDDRYRLMIRNKKARSLSDGTINKIIQALAFTLNTEPSEIKIRALWDGIEPAAIMIENIPIEILEKAGINTAEFEEIIQDVVSGGINIYISSSGLSEFLKLNGKSYAFPVNYRVTNRFRTAAIPGTKMDIPLILVGQSYQVDVNYKRCGAFRIGGR